MEKFMKIVIPHFLIMDESKIGSFTEENLSPAILSIAKNLDKWPDMKNGMIMATIKATGEDVPVCWYTNEFKYSFKIKSGKEKGKDNALIYKKLKEHLLMTSLQLTLNDNDELMAEFENGILNLKFDSGSERRIYKIEYFIDHSNFDIAMNEIKKEIEDFDNNKSTVILKL